MSDSPRFTVVFMNSSPPDFWGGGEKWMINAAALLIKRGHSVQIGCKPVSLLSKRAVEYGVPVRSFRIRGDFDPPMSLRIARFLRRQKADIVICNFMKDIRVAGLAGRMARVPLILARQGLVLCKKKLKYELGFRYLTDGLIVNSISVRDTYLSYGWFREHEIGVIHNGVTVTSDTSPYDIQKAFPGTKDRMTILSAGRLDPQKGFFGLLEVAKRAKEMNKSWIFLIAGEGELKDELRARIADNNLSDFVCLIGFQSELRSLMKACDVFVLPSRFEGMPNVVMEAMAEGTPVIASDVNGIKELMIDGETGYLVPPDSPDDFVDRLAKIEERDSRERMGRAARERVLRCFTWERMADQLETYLFRRLGDS